MVLEQELDQEDDESSAETAEDAAGDPRAITQALTAWRPTIKRRVHLDTLALLTWPQGVAIDSPQFEHFLASVVAPFCARYPTPSTQLLYRRSLTYFFRWWGQAREQAGESDQFTAQLLQHYRTFLTETQGQGTGTR